ncbi:PLL family lectin [Flindersiella endophytica]
MKRWIALLLVLTAIAAAAGFSGPAREAAASCRTAPIAAAAAPPTRTNDQPTLDLFARGTDNQLYHRWWTAGNPWTCWESLQGNVASAAGVASHGAGILHLGVLGNDGRVIDRSFVNSGYLGAGWSNWTTLGTQQFSSAPAAASWSDSHFEMFVRGRDDKIWHNWYRFGGGGWSGWYAFDGAQTFAEAPAAVSYAPDRLHVFAKGSDGRIYERHHLGSGTWSAWAALGSNTFASGPAAVSWDSTHLEVFARGTDDKIWHNWYRFGGGGWSGWYAFDGAQTFTEAPAAATHAPGTLNLFALGTDHRVWQRYHLGGGQWSAWERMGDEQFTSAPTAASWSNR